MPDVENVQEAVLPTPCFVEVDSDAAGTQSVQKPRSVKVYFILFLLTTVVSSAICIPSIIEGLKTLRTPTPVASQVVNEHKAAQSEALDTMRELESAVQNPQGR